MPSAPHSPTAQILWLDPGETTGVAVLACKPAWLSGEGDADWAGLRKALRLSWFAEIGAEPRQWDGVAGHARRVESSSKLPAQLFNGPGVDLYAENELSMIYELREIMDSWPAAAWGYEDYVPESMAAAQKGALAPMRVFSTLAFGAIMDDDRPRVPFVRSRTMKSSATNERMKLAGLYLPGMNHATDAARHAAVFLRSARQSHKLRAQAWPRLFGR